MGTNGKDMQAAVVVQIRAEMGALDWNQRDLAAAAGMQTSTLHRYLSGLRDIPVPVLAEVSQALGLPLLELLARAQRRTDTSAP